MINVKNLLPLLAISLLSALSTSCVLCDPQNISLQKKQSMQQQTIIASAEITNANYFAMQQEPMYFSFYDLGIKSAREKSLKIVKNNVVIPSQLIDRDGNGELDGVFFTLDFPDNTPHHITFVDNPHLPFPPSVKQTQAEISVKEGGKWQGKEYIGGAFTRVQKVSPPPQYTDHSSYIRYEGPGIESDKVGYRIYLDWRNGFDIFGKKTTAVVLQNVGLDGYESYHHDAPWGQDILKVGKSLGMGGFGYWNGKSVELVSATQNREAVITNNGDLFSAFRINYNQWQIKEQKHNISADFSMTAGSRLAKVHLQTDRNLPNFAIGLVKLPDTQLFEGPTNISGSAWTYVATWGAQSLSTLNKTKQSYNKINHEKINADALGMAVIFRRADRKEQHTDDNSYVSVMNTNGGDLEYYFVAAWEHEPNGIRSQSEFRNYLDREIVRLTKTPRVRLTSRLSNEAKTSTTAAAALQWSKQLADAELTRKTLNYHFGGWDAYRKRPPKFEYDIVGMQIHALQELNSISPDPKYTDALEAVTGSYIQSSGAIATFDADLFSIDLTKPGQMVILLEQQTGQTKYRKAADFLRARLKVHPRTTEGAFWHRATYPNQLWLDGVYMGMPFLAQYAASYETGEAQHQSFAEAVHEFTIARKHLRNSQTGLYYHAWDESKKAEWADKNTGVASQYWSRGMGWYAMALVDVLDYLPVREVALRTELITIIQEFAADILRYQDPQTATWWQITDKPAAVGNYRESSASAMFSYFLLKAVNKGYLPPSYRDKAITSYQGLVNEFIRVHTDGKISMTNQCLVAGLGFGRDGSYDYYQTEPIVANDPKGNVPFILAGLEAYKLLKQ